MYTGVVFKQIINISLLYGASCIQRRARASMHIPRALNICYIMRNASILIIDRVNMPHGRFVTILVDKLSVLLLYIPMGEGEGQNIPCLSCSNFQKSNK
jgi:hypothetical protein